MPREIRPPTLYQVAQDAGGAPAILAAVRAAKGSRKQAAEVLGLSRSEFFRELRRLGLQQKLKEIDQELSDEDAVGEQSHG